VLILVAGLGLAMTAAPRMAAADSVETWMPRATTAAPSARAQAAMAYDAAHHAVVLFGGDPGSPATFSPTNDTWTWDGQTWTQRHPATTPGSLSDPAMVYDAARGQLVLVGTCYDFNPECEGSTFQRPLQTWTWDGSDWTRHQTTSDPSGRHAPALAYDEARQQVVLFGGCCNAPSGRPLTPGFGDTETWDGTTWTLHQPAQQPLDSTWLAMGYDPTSQRILLFGALDHNDDLFSLVHTYGVPSETWTWDGVDWTHEQPSTSPPPRQNAAMALDPQTHRLVLFGGCPRTGGGSPTNCQSQPLGDTWTWDGSSWAQLQPPMSPPPRGGAHMAADLDRGNDVLFGGSTTVPGGGPTTTNDTWTYGLPTTPVGGSLEICLDRLEVSVLGHQLIDAEHLCL
jgi:hypothetical protein